MAKTDPTKMLPEHEITINLDDADHEKQVHCWGGKTLLRVIVIENGKRVVAFLSARKSGDIRAGSTKGLHFALTINKRGSETSKHAHAQPWLPVCREETGGKDGPEACQEALKDGACPLHGKPARKKAR